MTKRDTIDAFVKTAIDQAIEFGDYVGYRRGFDEGYNKGFVAGKESVKVAT